MKRIIATLLVVCMVLVSNVFVFATGPVTNYKSNVYKDFITYNAPLTNTYMRLTNDKELNVVYFGGSVTEGYGVSKQTHSWRALSGNWLKENFPTANINTYTAAIGGTGAHLGVVRLQTDVIARKPDLVFVEFAMNDNYNGNSKKESARYFETIIRDIRAYNPNCDIITVLIIDRSKAAEYPFPELYPNAEGYVEVANAYGIPVINVGQALYETVLAKSSDTEDWNIYFVDSVHPSNQGHIEYNKCIVEYLTNALLNTDFSGCEKTPHKTPDLYSDYLFDGDRKTLEGQELKNMATNAVGFEFAPEPTSTGIHTHDGCFCAKDIADSSITLKFTGTELTLWTNLSSGSSVTYSVDGGSEKSYNFPHLGLVPIVSDLKPGEHTITIKPKYLQSDVSTFKILAACTRDASKQTAKPHVCEPADSNWIKSETGHYQLCSCGEKLNVSEHVFTEWEITKQATQTANGIKKRTCKDCGKNEFEKYSLNEEINPPAQSETNGEKGGGFPIIPVAVGGGALAVILIAVLIFKKKK